MLWKKNLISQVQVHTSSSRGSGFTKDQGRHQ
ncbi:hypothetical protein AB205_0156040 [Aquarana catesbeiana]|uniref:Uncharacterized protein n=1 Tax=Aquarana catesbeiana TaxID=8400 RepID=A0A2G9RAA6_AQUCT|nr:hypothetical protein AB205_0156040 [Aquarana catesbeiana]